MINRVYEKDFITFGYSMIHWITCFVALFSAYDIGADILADIPYEISQH
jgi:hypothetical protein